VLAELALQRREERHESGRRLRLRLVPDRPVRVELLRDVDPLLVEVDVGPRQPERLGDAEPGVGAGRGDRPEGVAHLREQLGDLGRVEVARFGQAREAGPVVAVEVADDVPLDELLPDGVAEERRGHRDDLRRRLRRELRAELLDELPQVGDGELVDRDRPERREDVLLHPPAVERDRPRRVPLRRVAMLRPQVERREPVGRDLGDGRDERASPRPVAAAPVDP
jgi:hypothetical protein